MADAILALLQDPARREAMGRAGVRRVEEHFTAERMVRDTLGVYEQCTAGGSAGRSAGSD
jgi:glycosyltransferase involved in cell wall biosynthesis